MFQIAVDLQRRFQALSQESMPQASEQVTQLTIYNIKGGY